MNEHTWDVFHSPLGPLTLVAEPAGLAAIRFPGRGPALDERTRASTPATTQVAAALADYFAGSDDAFSDLALALVGTPFQRRVWATLQAIPYGGTVSYTQLADLVGRPDGVRAVAAAVGRTPTPIVVPCHRVIGADGSLTGYGGGLQRKSALLDLEAAVRCGGAPEPAWALRQLELA